jgi:predicted anti-sigma-YlaC factor YlaD
MSRFIAVLSAAVVAAIVLVNAASFTPAAAAADADTVKQAKANCKAEVKERARYHEMSWWARHKAVQKCVKAALAGH